MPVVTLDMVRELVQSEIAKCMPVPSVDRATKVCSQCGASSSKSNFTACAWKSAEPVCKTCRAPNEKLQKRQLTEKVCSVCKERKAKDNFTHTQWTAGVHSTCKACIHKQSFEAKIRTKACSACGLTLPKENFSRTQWEQAKAKGSKCKNCSAQAAVERQAAFTAERSEEIASDAWGSHDVGEAQRYLLHCPLEDLPSGLPSLETFCFPTRAFFHIGFVPHSSLLLPAISFLKFACFCFFFLLRCLRQECPSSSRSWRAIPVVATEDPRRSAWLHSSREDQATQGRP